MLNLSGAIFNPEFEPFFVSFRFLTKIPEKSLFGSKMTKGFGPDLIGENLEY